MRRIALLASFFIFYSSSLTSADQVRSDFQISGFKGVIFGMSVAEVAAIDGYRCKENEFTVGDLDVMSCNADDTLFGMRARVYVIFKRGEVTSIHVTARSNRPINLVEDFTKALGPPRRFVTPSIGGFPLHMSYWLSQSKTSVSVSVVPERPNNVRTELGGLTIYEQKAAFDDRRGTEELMRRESVSRNRQRDF